MRTAMAIPRRKFLRLALGAAAVPAMSPAAQGQAYPSRPVRLIVGFGPAGLSDLAARLIGPWLSERLGRQFVIENRPGAGGNLATEAVVRAAPDGYTLLLAQASDAINATLYEKLNFVFVRDITPVAGLIVVPNVLVLHPSVPANYCLRQSQSRQAQYGVGRQRKCAPCGRRTVQDDERDQHGSRTLSRRGACAD